MTFAEKLSFLMKLTSTSNKQLAEAIRVDPSLISLLKNGRRDMPKNQSHIHAMVACFVRRIQGDYQRMALSEAMGGAELDRKMSTENLGRRLEDWLSDGRDHVSRFLDTFETFSLASVEETAPGEVPVVRDSVNSVYFGNEGKRNAVDAFIALLMQLDKPGEVLLSIDESMDWLVEDERYLTRVQAQITQLLKRGFRICRIAAPLLTADQAFQSLSRWLPLYMTGQVESYYYPRLRDGLYRRTLIVLPGVAAISSTSMANLSSSRAMLYLQDSRLASALAEDFRDFLHLCKPMMLTYSVDSDISEIRRCILQFERDQGNRIQQSTTLSTATVPPAILRHAVDGLPEHEGRETLRVLMESQERFRESLARYEAVDINRIATVEEVRAGTVPIGVGYMTSTQMFYTPETYADHLESILRYVQKYPNYRVVLLGRGEEMHSLMVKEGRQALFLRPVIPLAIFELTQPYIAEACHEYLERIAMLPFSPFGDEDVTVTLRRLIRELREE